MNITVNGYGMFFVILVCFIASVMLVPLVKRVALYIGAVDKPNARKIHKEPIPTLGGLAIFLAFLIGYMIFGVANSLMLSILIASFLILLLGVFDDINPIPAKIKFVIHLLIGAIIVFYGGLKIGEITMLGLNFNFGVLSPYATIIFIVAIINAINLIDGLDGLASGVSIIYFATIAIIAILLERTSNLEFMLCLIMLGSTLGFLAHNFPPAKIFMGDTGSTFLGLIIAVIALLGFKNATLTSLFIPLLVLAIPILDTIFAMIRREIKGIGMSTPDKEHTHHQLLKRFSKTKTLLIIYAVNIIFSIATIFYAIGYEIETMVMYAILLVILVFFILKTDIIIDRTHKKEKKNK